MKTAKRIFALALCLVMVLGLATSAFAAGSTHSHTITIENHNDGYTYVAYQIFSGDLDAKGVLSNVEWGSGVDGAGLLAELKSNPAYASCTDAESVAVILSACKAMDDPIAIAFAEVAAKHIVAANGTDSVWNGSTKKYNISGLEDGYYLVVNTGVPAAENTVYSRYVLEVVRDITVAHKGTFPSVEKKIIEAELELDSNEAAIGEAVNYRITGTMPSNIQYYTTYKYVFHDTLSKGLTFNEDVVVTVNDVVCTELFTITKAATTATDKYAGGTDVTIAIDDLRAVETKAGALTPATEVVVTYSATVNEDAVIVDEGNPNKVYLEYDNNPNDEGAGSVSPDVTGKTPEDEVKSYVTELTIFKKDGQGNALMGAEFTLEGTSIKTVVITREEFTLVDASTPAGVEKYWKLKDGTYTTTAPVSVDDPATPGIDERTEHLYAVPTTDLYYLKTVVEEKDVSTDYKVSSFVGGDGYVTFTGLGAGKYTLTETVTPAGFNTIDPIEFEITFDSKTGKFAENASNWIMVETDNTLYAEILNVAGSTLPSTGGIGTTIFYVLGGILFAGAVVLLITKKRMTE